MPPKRVVQPQQQPSTPPDTVPEELSPDVKYLRTQSKWAAVCQYITTFMPAIGVPDYTVQVKLVELSNPIASLREPIRAFASGFHGRGYCLTPHPLRCLTSVGTNPCYGRLFTMNVCDARISSRLPCQYRDQALMLTLKRVSTPFLPGSHRCCPGLTRLCFLSSDARR